MNCFLFLLLRNKKNESIKYSTNKFLLTIWNVDAAGWVLGTQTMSSFTQSFHIPHKLLFSCLPPRSSAVTNPHLRLDLMSQILCWSGASSVKTLEFRRLEFFLHSVTFEPTSNKEKTRLLQLDFCMWSRKLNIRESRNGCICRACKFNIFRQ